MEAKGVEPCLALTLSTFEKLLLILGGKHLPAQHGNAMPKTSYGEDMPRSSRIP
jgi:hypothetical protein